MRRECKRYLRPGWLPLYPQEEVRPFIDVSDQQWHAFRGALPLILLGGALLSLLVRGGVAVAGDSPSVRLALQLVIGVGYVAYVHGAGALFLLVLALMFFLVARFLGGSRLAAPALWALALLAIAAKETSWPIRRHLTYQGIFGSGAAFLDGPGFQGEYDWAHSVNLLILRLLSFSLDYHRAAGKAAQIERDPYTLGRCVAHGFYAPLFLAGPTICFDDFAAQSDAPKPAAQRTHLGWYLVQLLVGIVYLEVGTHTYPCFALARSGVLGHLGPRLGATAIFFTLNLMWLKFFVLWRVARAWALAEGIDPPENMTRALCNHYSVASFWRCWHSSYNRWLVRYIFVPVGGRDRRIMATALVFLFVSVWHDAQAKLLAWGGLNALFIALEYLIGSALRRRTSGLALKKPFLYRQLGAFGGATCIFLLMAVNMIGYSVGLHGIGGLLAGAAEGSFSETLIVIGGGYALFVSGTHVMLEIRGLEAAAKEEFCESGTSVAPEMPGQSKIE